MSIAMETRIVGSQSLNLMLAGRRWSFSAITWESGHVIPIYRPSFFREFFHNGSVQRNGTAEYYSRVRI
jgi:hypothetical protein